MNQMIGADRQPVAIPGDDPDLQIRTADSETGGNRRRPAMDGVESVGIHVIGKTAGTADPRNEDDVLPWDAQFTANFRHDALHLCQDGIITTTRTPTDILV